MNCKDDYSRDYTFASLPRTTRGFPLIISGNSDGSKFLYCNSNSIFIRDVENINICDIYTEHSNLTTVAKYSPSGFYIASGDQTGKLRIWDTTQSSHILTAEYSVISGSIRDIAWSDDSKRIAVVGEGREKFGHVFLFETGTSNGNLSGQSRTMSSIDFRPVRPYRLVSTSEDNSVAIFEGPPFKFKTLLHEHTRFAHIVRFNPEGSVYASGGADGRIILYDGLNGNKVDELLDKNCKNTAHNGGVFSISWNKDGTKLASASGDKTVKIWNVANKNVEKVISFGTETDNQQVAVLWLNKIIISVSLNGFVNYIDSKTFAISQIIKGHNRPITAMTMSRNKKFAFTGDCDGNICRWEIATGQCERLTPKFHKSQISSLEISENGTLISTSWDDTIVFSNNVLQSFDNLEHNSIKLLSQPRSITSLLNLKYVAVVCEKFFAVFEKDKQLISMNILYEGTAIDIHPTKEVIAVGGQDGKIRIYEFNKKDVIEKKLLSHSGEITSLKFSPNGNYLAATDATRKIVPYNVLSDYKICSQKEWSFHTARINCCAWSENSRYIATGSLDTNIIVWDIEKSGEHPIIIKGAHTMSSIKHIAWLTNSKLLSAGQDSNLKQWTINL